MIGLDLIKYPHSGMGKVALDYSKELLAINDFHFGYLLSGNQRPDHLRDQSVEYLSWGRKYNSGYMKAYDLCHIIHQLPKYDYRNARKMVFTIHDLNFRYTKKAGKQEKYRKQVQRGVDKADAVCFISEFVRRDCMDHLDIPANKLTEVIYNGVGHAEPACAKPDWCPESGYLFSIGQFLEKKNFHVLLPFLALLSDFRLVIAGENATQYGTFLRNQIKKYGLQDRVILPGAVTEAQKTYLYEHCDAFVFPSIAEGFGLPLIEAMKCSKPVFCSDRTGLKEIGGAYAFFWEDFDPHEMKKCFLKGMTLFANSSVLKHQAKLYADSFTWKKNVGSYLKIYHHLLS